MRRTVASKTQVTPPLGREVAAERIFSAEEVSQALPYVERVLSDAVDAYNTAQRVRRELARCPNGLGHARLTQERDAAVAMLNRTVDECHAMGIAYIDIPRARVAFRVEFEGRPASVVWRLGEDLQAGLLEGAE